MEVIQRIQTASCYNTPVTGEPRVIGSSQDVLAKVGDDVTLPCQVEPSVNLETMTVEWSRPDLRPEYVNIRQTGHAVNDFLHPLYKQRTDLFPEELCHGNISLKLSTVQISDEGTFKCFVPSLRSSSEIRLLVGDVSQPVISLNGPKETGLSLTCDSGCWYPQPEVSWLDSDENLLPAERSVTPTGSQHCYVVQSNVTVTRAGRVTCRVHLPHINHTIEIEKVLSESEFRSGELAVGIEVPTVRGRWGLIPVIPLFVIILVGAMLRATC